MSDEQPPLWSDEDIYERAKSIRASGIDAANSYWLVAKQMRDEYEAKLAAVQDKCLCDCDACKYCEKLFEDSHE